MLRMTLLTMLFWMTSVSIGNAQCPTGQISINSTAGHNVAEYYAAGDTLYLVDSWYDPSEDPDLQEPGDMVLTMPYGPGGGSGGGGEPFGSFDPSSKIDNAKSPYATNCGAGLRELEEVIAVGTYIGWGRSRR